MAAFKAYKWEAETWPEFQNISIARSDASSYFKKFARHFKVNPPKLDRRIKKDGGTYYNWSNSIAISNTTTFDIIIHEFAHCLAKQKYDNDCHHNKRFKHELKRVYTFAQRYIND